MGDFMDMAKTGLVLKKASEMDKWKGSRSITYSRTLLLQVWTDWGSAAKASPDSLGGMQSLRPHPRPTELWVGPCNLF